MQANSIQSKMNTYPLSRPNNFTHECKQSSLPVLLKRKIVSGDTVQKWKIENQNRCHQQNGQKQIQDNKQKNADNDFVPNQQQESEESFSSSYMTSYRSSGYDPLENMDEYLRMRDKL